MPRVVKEHEYAAKRSDILNTTQRLIVTKGYEQMTIQDILDDLTISKGAFYHYFASKPAVLEAMIERMLDEVLQLLDTIVHDPQLGALEKFERFFADAARWKSARKGFILALINVWYTDDNAIVRQKLRASRIKRIGPMLSVIIQQGIREGSLSTEFPDEIGEVVMALFEDLGDTIGELLLSHQHADDRLQSIKRAVAVYIHSLERLLSAPPGSLKLIDDQVLQEWIAAV